MAPLKAFTYMHTFTACRHYCQLAASRRMEHCTPLAFTQGSRTRSLVMFFLVGGRVRVG